jgi:transposase
MIVGIDVHKHNHAAALIDDRGGEIATFTVANTPKGYRSLIDWLVDHDAAQAVIGVESPGSYGRCLVAALAGAGFEVLQVPAWRTHRERHRRGPGKTDPGDAISIAHVVRTKREDLGPAEEPELVRALGMLELQRRRFVRDRTQAIQRLRADWTQHDPVAEAGVIRCDRQRELNKLRRLQLGPSLAARTAARCIRELARDITDLNKRIAELDREIAQLLAEHENPLADLHGAGTNLAATIIAQAGDVRRFRNAAAFARFCGAAPIPCGSGQTANRHRLHRGGNRQLNAALYRIAVVQQRHHPQAKTYLARKIAEGKTPKEARRALKRHLANVLYRRLYAWANAAPSMNLLTYRDENTAAAFSSGGAFRFASLGRWGVVGERRVGRPCCSLGREPVDIAGRPCDRPRLGCEPVSVAVVRPLSSPSISITKEDWCGSLGWMSTVISVRSRSACPASGHAQLGECRRSRRSSSCSPRASTGRIVS